MAVADMEHFTSLLAGGCLGRGQAFVLAVGWRVAHDALTAFVERIAAEDELVGVEEAGRSTSRLGEVCVGIHATPVPVRLDGVEPGLMSNSGGATTLLSL
jgi:hypothetical protein